MILVLFSSFSASSSVPWLRRNRFGCEPQATVQQQHSNGDTEGLSFHFVRRFESTSHTTAPQTKTEEQTSLSSPPVVEDGYIIFRSKGSCTKRLVGTAAEKANNNHDHNNNSNSVPAKKSKKDPNHPRGYISAFNFFVKDKRPSFVQDGQNGQVGESCVIYTVCM